MDTAILANNDKLFIYFNVMAENQTKRPIVTIWSKYINKKYTKNLKSVILNATSKFRNHNNPMYSMKNAYYLKNLLKITF